MKSEQLYQIGLTMIEGIGDINTKALVAYCGSASEVFRQKKSHLQKIPGIGVVHSEAIAASASVVLKRAEEEMRFTEKHAIQCLFFTDKKYPHRLRMCADGPAMLYYKGSADLNHDRIIAVVGTRQPSEYGNRKASELIADLSGQDIIVVSGLAYGVDHLAHRSALHHGLPTIGVLGHGLDRIYPQEHARLAKKMLGQGGLLTDFRSGTKPDAVNFPKRNRVVAGICDALVVIESKRTGGSLITATIANSYNKDVFAFPGRAGEELSEGCNGLIKRNRAALIESAEDLLDAMQWQPERKPAARSRQIPLVLSLRDDEKKIFDVLVSRNPLHIDEICHAAGQPVSRVSALLLQLEFSNLVRSLPGKIYELA